MEIKDEERMATIPVIVHELDMAKLEQTHEASMNKLERANRRLLAIIVLLLGLIAYLFFGFDYATIDINSQDGGNANYLQAGSSGVIHNAEDSGKKTSPQE